MKTNETPTGGELAAALRSALPCPFCGGTRLQDFYGILTTSKLGIDQQSGSMNCMECGASGPWETAYGPETDAMKGMLISAWNNSHINDQALSRQGRQWVSLNAKVFITNKHLKHLSPSR